MPKRTPDHCLKEAEQNIPANTYNAISRAEHGRLRNQYLEKYLEKLVEIFQDQAFILPKYLEDNPDENYILKVVSIALSRAKQSPPFSTADVLMQIQGVLLTTRATFLFDFSYFFNGIIHKTFYGFISRYTVDSVKKSIAEYTRMEGINPYNQLLQPNVNLQETNQNDSIKTQLKVKNEELETENQALKKEKEKLENENKELKKEIRKNEYHKAIDKSDDSSSDKEEVVDDQPENGESGTQAFSV